MKKILLGLLSIFCLFSPALIQAQSFTAAADPGDTVWATINSGGPVNDNITNRTGSNLTLNWHVTATTFPNDWLTSGALGICDNVLCRPNSGGSLWNTSTSSGNIITSTYYANATHDSTGSFNLSLDFTSATSIGSHSITINIADAGSLTTKNLTFVINRPPLGVTNVNNPANNIILYPNPAKDELNVVYDANADIKNIAVYNIIGKVMTEIGRAHV